MWLSCRERLHPGLLTQAQLMTLSQVSSVSSFSSSPPHSGLLPAVPL